MQYILETERLRLRKLTLEDSLFFVELLNSPGWLKYIGDRNVKTEEDAKRYLLNGPLQSYADYGYGLSLVEKKEDACPIGICGIINREGLEFPDIGFAFLPEFHSQGYAYEIASALMTYAREKLNLQTITAITVPENLSSIKLLEKIGLKFQKKFLYPDTNEELLLYST